MTDAPQPTPYRDAAPGYRAAGWLGVIPVPFGTKKLTGRKGAGWTGHAGAWPSPADVYAWCESDAADEGGGNIILRLPADVIGLDVDAYADKAGAATLSKCVAKWGELPPTWTSTARDDGVSGIRLYRVPEGLRWPGQLGEHVEIIQTSHRYAVVAPSVHPNGGRYRWIRPDTITSTAPPEPDDLPELPAAWIAGLTAGEQADEVVVADLSVGDVQTWIARHDRPGMCRAMTTTLAKLIDEIRGGSAHEALRRTFGLCRLSEQGHAGLTAALVQVRAAFVGEVTRDGREHRRTPEEADGEFRRSLAGAVRKVVGNPTVDDHAPPPVDPCVDPFDSIVDPSVITGPATTPGPGPGPQLANPPTPAQIPQNAPAPAGPDGHANPGAFGVDGETWRRRDLSAAMNGKPEQPTLLARADKRCLFYAGKINSLIGESESGKSWLALLAVAQEIEAGRNVVYVDFEDTDRTLVQRLVALGVAPEVIVERVAYISPEETLTPSAAEFLAVELAAGDPSLAVLDGVNAAMARLGLDSNSTTDATRFSQVLLSRLVAGGAGVVTIDHVSKNKETRGKGGIGSQAKRAMISGAAITCEVITPFGRGMQGKIKLIIDKDRHGGVRETAAYGKNPGTVLIRSQTDPDRVRIEISPEDGNTAPTNDDGAPAAFRPTGLMDKISRYLAREGAPLSQRAIEREVGGRAQNVRAALRALEDGRYVERQPGPNRSFEYRHINVYREIDEMVDRGDSHA